MYKSTETIKNLLQPIELKTFFSEYWEQNPLVISRDNSDFYLNLISTKDIDYIIGFAKGFARVTSASKTQRVETQQRSLPSAMKAGIDDNQLYDYYQQGQTIVIGQLHHYWDPVARLCRDLESFFHHPVGTNLYLTPKHSQAFKPHADLHDVFILQVEGSKDWRIYEPLVQLPISRNKYTQNLSESELGAPLSEVNLAPGDMLYLPRGYIHQAHTTETPSMHLTVGVNVFTWSDLVTRLLISVSQKTLAFRKALPMGFSHQEETKAMMKDHLTELLELLMKHASLEDAIDSLTQDFIDHMKVLPDGHFSCLDQLDQIDLDTKIAKRKGMICRVTREDDSAIIQFPGNSIKGPAYIEPALYFIANSEEFPVKAIPLSDKSKLTLARRLIREGLLTIVEMRS
ncbi:MAG: cupin domain-containing protein [Xenococcaceae cyanobacterium]